MLYVSMGVDECSNFEHVDVLANYFFILGLEEQKAYCLEGVGVLPFQALIPWDSIKHVP